MSIFRFGLNKQKSLPNITVKTKGYDFNLVEQSTDTSIIEPFVILK